MDVFLARQAIFDRTASLFGYELLFRSSPANTARVIDDSSSTLHVLANSLLTSGFQSVSSGAPVFVNFGKEMLTSDWTSLFPPQSVVIEILESVRPDPEVIEACLKLRSLGYRIALDDVFEEEGNADLVELAHFVKIDFRQTTTEAQRRLAQKYHRLGKYLLAEKVETHAEFESAREAGYDLFQGFFFAKPTLLKGHQIPNLKVNALRLLSESQRSDLNYPSLENIIKSDVSLTYKLFRYVNSALFARAKPVSAIREALVVMGELDIRRWITLATLPDLGAGQIRELVLHALVRARFCEALADAGGILRSGDAFIVGMFSLLDALVNRPLAEVLAELTLPEHLCKAMLDPSDSSKVANVFRIALHYEAGEWTEVSSRVARLGLSEQAVSGIYVEAINWSDQIVKLIDRGTGSRPEGIAGVARTSSASDLMAMRKAITPRAVLEPHVIRR